jgi:type I restriction enzyme S subunit
MIVDELRRSILYSAFTGLLTEHHVNPNGIDEDSNNIYSKYVDKTWKSKKIVTVEEQLKTIKDIHIPSNWKWKKLSDIGSSNIGLTYSPINISKDNNGTIVLRSSNIKNGKLDFSDIVKVNISIADSKKCHLNDILICTRNGSKNLVGKCAIVDKSDLSFGAFMAIYRCGIQKYVYYYLNSSLFKIQMAKNQSTETINQITQDMLFNCIIPIPPLEEQQRIVDKIEKLFQKLDEIKPIEEELNTLKIQFPKEMKKAILVYNILGLENSDEISLNDYKKISFSKNWKWLRFGDLATCRMGETILSNNLSNKGIPVYSATNTDKVFGYVNKSNVVLKKEDIVIPARGNSIGNATLINDEVATCTQTTIACYPNSNISSKYLYYCCYALKDVWFKYTGSAIPQITISNIKENFVPLPPYDEQQKIVEKLDRLLPLCDDIEKLVKDI